MGLRGVLVHHVSAVKYFPIVSSYLFGFVGLCGLIEWRMHRKHSFFHNNPPLYISLPIAIAIIAVTWFWLLRDYAEKDED